MIKDLRKHKNDVFVLHELMTTKKLDGIPKSISNDVMTFIDAMKLEQIDAKRLQLSQSIEEIIESLNTIYGE